MGNQFASFLSTTNRKIFFKQFFIAIFFSSISIFIKVWIPAIGREAPYLLFTTGVIASTWFGGMFSGILTGLISAATVVIFFVGTSAGISTDPGVSLQAGIFVAECLFVSLIVDRVKTFEEKLSISQALLNRIFSSIKEHAIVVLNEKGQVISWNNGVEELTGYSPMQLAGKHFSFLYTRQEKKLGITRREIKKAFKNVQLKEKNWIVTNGGNKVFVEDETLPITGINNETNLILKILTKIPQKNSLVSPEESRENSLPPSLIPTIIHA